MQQLVLEFPEVQISGRSQIRLIASPNPASERSSLYYEFLNPEAFDTAQLEVYNILGHRIDQRTLTQPKGEEALEVSSYSSVTYIVVLKQQNKVIKQIILIKE